VAKSKQPHRPQQVRAVAMSSTDGVVRHGRRGHRPPITVQSASPRSADPHVIASRSMKAADSESASAGRFTAARPAFVDLEPKTQVFETGIKVIDLIAPFVKGARSDCRRGRRRQNRRHSGADQQRPPRHTAGSRSSAASRAHARSNDLYLEFKEAGILENVALI